MKLSTERILSLLQPMYQKAVKELDVSAGLLCLKGEERLACLFGLDQSPTQRVDIYQVEAQQKPSQHDQMRNTILAFLDRMPEPQKRLRARLEGVDPEEALRALDAAGIKGKSKPTEGNGRASASTDGNGSKPPTEPSSGT